ncbi:HAD family hydrolase [Alicyclobacillus mengziensis]|uniref:HAD family phosphatase n=1 Tax=Alicyclobacillus mengziensis TaxID=2931921 RepID=A0A9X7VYU6_9BACL|nr:HAD family phosphatase [Alicyclobacillus mengziensis]QSO47332.1 HAD family phosphatase [Alicyclobacillus mengziensis]
MQAIIFDMDGVLVDSEPLDRRAWVQVLGQYGVQVSEDDILSFTGRPTAAVLEHYRRTNPALNENILIEKHEVFYELAKVQLQPMPGVEKFLQALQNDGLPLAVASSSSHERIHFSLSRTGLLRYFQVVCSGEEVTNPKPAPDVFLHTASKLQVHPASCAVIEDSIHGITAARKAGMNAYGYTSSFPAAKLLEAGAQFTFDEFESLEQYLRTENK